MSADKNTDRQAPTRLTDQRVADLVVDVSREGVSLEVASNATGCGAVGCRTTEGLIQATVSGFGQRVLCATHLARLIRREVPDE